MGVLVEIQRNENQTESVTLSDFRFFESYRMINGRKVSGKVEIDAKPEYWVDTWIFVTN